MRIYPLLAEVVRFHQRLCEQLKLLESDVLAPEYTQSHTKYGQAREQGLFKLTETFSNIFIVADHKAWRERGVLLVSKDEETATAHGINEGGQGVPREKSLDVEGVGSSCAFRTTLKRSMQAVVFCDSERRKGQKEYNEASEEH